MTIVTSEMMCYELNQIRKGLYEHQEIVPKNLFSIHHSNVQKLILIFCNLRTCLRSSWISLSQDLRLGRRRPRRLRVDDISVGVISVLCGEPRQLATGWPTSWNVVTITSVCVLWRLNYADCFEFELEFKTVKTSYGHMCNPGASCWVLLCLH